MIDTHSHLADSQFDNDFSQMIERAKAAGVEKAIVCAEFRSDFEKIMKLAEEYPDFIRPAIGVHPVQKESTSANWSHFDGVEEYLKKNHTKLIAIGEIGLDFTPRYLKNEEDDKKVQREILKKQIELANEYNLPVNVHSRSAGKPAISWLIENGAKKVQMHAFSGNVKSAKEGINAGYYFSIPPSFSLNENEKIPLISAIPLELLLLETDSPVLGPSKTERNEPANIGISAKLIAKAKNISVEEVIKQTTENAKTLYPFL
uniref:Uncharacterized protein n=1 Tax=Panagrolaimus superbus TaxID=310955 RepID=A0A914YL77_9BILA